MQFSPVLFRSVIELTWTSVPLSISLTPPYKGHRVGPFYLILIFLPGRNSARGVLRFLFPGFLLLANTAEPQPGFRLIVFDFLSRVTVQGPMRIAATF